jgi:RNB domain
MMEDKMHTNHTWDAIAIDSDMTQVFDDALSIEQTPTGWTANLYVTDVASSVPIDSEEDREARLTGMTLKGQNGNPPIRLFPHQSHMGLDPSASNPVIKITITIDKEGNTQLSSLSQAQARIHCLTWKQVGSLLAHTDVSPLYHMVSNMMQCARILLQRRLQITGMSPDQYDDNFLNKNTMYGQLHARAIVKEFILCTNGSISRSIHALGWNMLYRINDKRRLGTLGNASTYASFTSPARQYADLVNQRIALAFMREEGNPYSDDDLNDLARSLGQLIQNNRELEKGGNPKTIRMHYKTCQFRRFLASITPNDWQSVHEIIKVCMSLGQAPNNVVEMVRQHGCGQLEKAYELLTCSIPALAPLREALVDYIRVNGCCCRINNPKAADIPSLLSKVAHALFRLTSLSIVNGDQTLHVTMINSGNQTITGPTVAIKEHKARKKAAIAALGWLMDHLAAGTQPIPDTSVEDTQTASPSF